MLPRFYAPGLDPSTARTVLAADESHHLARVLRLGPGDAVAIFDGRGREFLARVERVDRDAATVALVRANRRGAGTGRPRDPRPGGPQGRQDGRRRPRRDDGGRRAHRADRDRPHGIKVSALKRAHAGERWQRVADRLGQAVPACVDSADRAGRPARGVAGRGLRRAARCCSSSRRPARKACSRCASSRRARAPNPPRALSGPKAAGRPRSARPRWRPAACSSTLGRCTLRADAVALAALAALSSVGGLMKARSVKLNRAEARQVGSSEAGSWKPEARKLT